MAHNATTSSPLESRLEPEVYVKKTASRRDSKDNAIVLQVRTLTRSDVNA
jgi:hypothetical protein